MNEDRVEGSFHYSEAKEELLTEDLKVGRELLERQPPEGYIQEWSNVLSKVKDKKDLSRYQSVLIFRIASEWLAMPISMIKEITEHQKNHTIPHKSNQTFKGVVNIRGELQLCFSLRHLVGLKLKDYKSPEDVVRTSQRSYQRMVVLKQGLSTWVFAVDEIYGIHHYYSQDRQNAPVTVEKDSNTFTKEMLYWKGKHVGILDGELILCALKRKFQQ